MSNQEGKWAVEWAKKQANGQMSNQASKWANKRANEQANWQMSKKLGNWVNDLANEWTSRPMSKQPGKWANNQANERVSRWVSMQAEERASGQMSKQGGKWGHDGVSIFEARFSTITVIIITHTTTTKLMIFSQRQLPLMAYMSLSYLNGENTKDTLQDSIEFTIRWW